MHLLILLVSVVLLVSVKATCPNGQFRLNGKCCKNCSPGWLWTHPCKHEGGPILCYYDCAKSPNNYHDLRAPFSCSLCNVCDPAKHVEVSVECGKTNNRECVPKPGFVCTRWDLQRDSCIEAGCPENTYYNPKEDRCCSLCRPGSRQKNECHKSRGLFVDTVCVACGKQTYSTEWTRNSNCDPCGKCSDHETLMEECKSTHNVRCQCKEGYTSSGDGDGDRCVKKV
ncbi:protein ORF136B [Cyprinid herpesvirus 1]|uniref:Protein ORF136B n=1 Tax=Cyprinid herpesvirus 1 TaxID=317858 RepID=K7PCA0_9VIRU|nr:protein ORF136B [Cyprinid herpesvirus 1]AFJ20427.1 protein ORF136B [Cyprinid herpesvirus 1]